MLLIVILSLLCSSVMSRPDKRDLTLTDKAVGEDVVDAVLWKINQAKMFHDDYCFFKRIAYHMTHFGDDPDTFNGTFTDGKTNNNIWYVYGDWISKLKLDNYSLLIDNKLNVKWNNITENDLLKPLISALGVFAIADYLSITIPESIDDQAKLGGFGNFDLVKVNQEMHDKGIKCLSEYHFEEITLGHRVLISLDRDAKVFICHSLPSYGLYLTLNETKGKVSVFYSFSYPYPSPALSDGFIDTTNEFISNPSADRVCFKFKGVEFVNQFTLVINDNQTTPTTKILPNPTTDHSNGE